MNSIILFGMPGGSEWLLILLVVLLIFGGKKIPELMKGLGSGIREFNNAKNDVKDKIREGMNEEPKKNNEENS
ncbi:MAG: twin-arginine translocase TatA/TatE family subunit [Bacteroidia bacterium]|nr:twin-arginine translocase TatA/TatE family subunit [Bacteroidia bacterium]